MALLTAVTMHGACLAAIVVLAAASLALRRQGRLLAAERRRERRMREELESYARLDVSTAAEIAAGKDAIEAQKALARRVCRAVGEMSIFRRVTMLLRNAEGRFVCLGSVGVDDLTVAALHAWGEQVVAEERGGARGGARSFERRARRVGARGGCESFAINLGEWTQFDREVGSWEMSGKVERRRWRRGLVAPIRMAAGAGRLMGVIAVCADGANLESWGTSLDKAMGPIESLAARVSAAMENEAMAERLLRAEKLAGLGQLAGGVAHALNNPLTAVLGFAELIAETAAEARVRKDAATIAQEALKMRDTVERLTEFWRPSPHGDEPVEMMRLLEELAQACREKLSERGVRLEIASDGTLPTVRGSRDRLRQVLEHLLNNAAQAIAGAGEPEEGEQHAIRVNLSADERALHIVVSDTGPGIREPGRVFDPYYTTRSPEQGAGLGLSICYGIVREHGGEISAFNLHPQGAAVVVELPVLKTVRESGSRVVVMPETGRLKRA